MTFNFILTDLDGKFVAGPFMTINQVPADTNWDTVKIVVTDWFDPKFGRFV